MKIVKINSEYITLGQFLKFTDIISSGGMVKFFLETAEIYVDGVLDLRRGRKLYSGMIVQVVGHGEFKIENQ